MLLELSFIIKQGIRGGLALAFSSLCMVIQSAAIGQLCVTVCNKIYGVLLQVAPIALFLPPPLL